MVQHRVANGRLSSASGARISHHPRAKAALRANVLVPLVISGGTVRDLAEDFDLIYNPPLGPAVDPLKVAASQAMRDTG